MSNISNNFACTAVYKDSYAVNMFLMNMIKARQAVKHHFIIITFGPKDP